jgi:hypothetical protein
MNRPRVIIVVFVFVAVVFADNGGIVSTGRLHYNGTKHLWVGESDIENDKSGVGETHFFVFHAQNFAYWEKVFNIRTIQ